MAGGEHQHLTGSVMMLPESFLGDFNRMISSGVASGRLTWW
jgi:hypothetical protein